MTLNIQGKCSLAGCLTLTPHHHLNTEPDTAPNDPTNSIKSNWTLEQLGWNLLSASDFRAWDGMLGWFVERVEDNRTLHDEPYFKRWHGAALEYVA